MDKFPFPVSTAKLIGNFYNNRRSMLACRQPGWHPLSGPPRFQASPTSVLPLTGTKHTLKEICLPSESAWGSAYSSHSAPVNSQPPTMAQFQAFLNVHVAEPNAATVGDEDVSFSGELFRAQQQAVVLLPDPRPAPHGCHLSPPPHLFHNVPVLQGT
jgi:hypothetical protein